VDTDAVGAYARWQQCVPRIGRCDYPTIDSNQYTKCAPKRMLEPKSLWRLDPKLLDDLQELGNPAEKSKASWRCRRAEEMSDARTSAVEAVFDSVSVGNDVQEKLKKGRAYSSFRFRAIKTPGSWLKKYLWIGRTVRTLLPR